MNLLSAKYSKQVRNVKVRQMTAWVGNPAAFRHCRRQSHYSRAAEVEKTATFEDQKRRHAGDFALHLFILFFEPIADCLQGVVDRFTADISAEPL
ncbi:hypothetical protein H8B02_32425 [Bradyrhizobium sp. Pear77]|nr:hypothetical protein [Bradyrhizobium altum]